MRHAQLREVARRRADHQRVRRLIGVTVTSPSNMPPPIPSGRGSTLLLAHLAGEHLLERLGHLVGDGVLERQNVDRSSLARARIELAHDLQELAVRIVGADDDERIGLLVGDDLGQPSRAFGAHVEQLVHLFGERHRIAMVHGLDPHLLAGATHVDLFEDRTMRDTCAPVSVMTSKLPPG